MAVAATTSRHRPRRQRATTASPGYTFTMVAAPTQHAGEGPPVAAEGRHRGHQQQQGQAVDMAVAGELDDRQGRQGVPGDRRASWPVSRSPAAIRAMVARSTAPPASCHGREPASPGVRTWTATNQASATAG